MFNRIRCVICALMLMTIGFSGCQKNSPQVKIGVSFGVGQAARWVHEKEYMEERAKELGAEMEVRLNTTDEPKTQLEDCKELIDSGIQVLILTPRDVNNVDEILEYAKLKNVKVISYARVILGQKVDLFVGYDSGRFGQMLGQYLAEMVYEGNYIVLQGDPNDNNAFLVYNGAMRKIQPAQGSINILLDAAVPGWSPDVAERMVREVLAQSGQQVDAILAPNDKIAGACAKVLKELGVTNHVVITGMDAELDAVRRIVEGTQDMTVQMDLRQLATTAVDQAYNMVTGQEIEINTEFDNKSGEKGVNANLIAGQIVTKQNLDRLLIDSGYFTKEEVYGSK